MTTDTRDELLAALRSSDDGDTVTHLQCAAAALARAQEATEEACPTRAVENVRIATRALARVVEAIPDSPEAA